MNNPIYLSRCGGPSRGEMVWTAWHVVTKERFMSTLAWIEEWRTKCEIGQYQLMIADETDGYLGAKMYIEGCDPIQTFIFHDSFVLNSDRREPGDDLHVKLVSSEPGRRTYQVPLAGGVVESVGSAIVKSADAVGECVGDIVSGICE